MKTYLVIVDVNDDPEAVEGYGTENKALDAALGILQAGEWEGEPFAEEDRVSVLLARTYGKITWSTETIYTDADLRELLGHEWERDEEDE